MEALEPFRIANNQQNPIPFPYLRHKDACNFDIKLEVDIKCKEIINYMYIYYITKIYKFHDLLFDPVLASNGTVTTVCHSNYKYMYWTPRQQLAHHTVTGCNINPGDLMASGTISGEVCVN